MQTLLGHHWHHLPSEEVLELLETDQTGGLDRFAVETRQAHFGPNVISEKRKQARKRARKWDTADFVRVLVVGRDCEV